MNNCVEFYELISAYTDEELPESDRRRIDEHLSACENCSALIKIFQEISIAIDESEVPAPETLRGSVMEKILSNASVSDGVTSEETTPEKTVAAAERKNKRKPFQVILLRYTPIAACLAVMLLTLPWIIGMFNHKSYSPLARQSAPRMETFTQMDMAAENNAMSGGEADSELYSSYTLKVDGYDSSNAQMPAPSVSTSLEPEYPAIYESERSLKPENQAASESEESLKPKYPSSPESAPDPELAFGNAPTIGNAPPPSNAPEPLPVPTDAGVPAWGSTQRAPSNDDAAATEYPQILTDVPMDEPTPDDGSALNGMPEPVDAAAGGNAPLAPPMDVDLKEQAKYAKDDIQGFRNSFGDAYAFIEITGELPAPLVTYNPIPLDGWNNWKVYYEISRSTAQDLINKISARDGVSITYNKDDGSYAIVLYSPKEHSD